MNAPNPEPVFYDLDELKSSVDMLHLVRFYGYGPVRHGKDSWAILCPFHVGDDKPSLVITPAKHAWHCFGCGKGGSCIDFVMHQENVGKAEAIAKLADRAELSPGTPGAVTAPTTATTAHDNKPVPKKSVPEPERTPAQQKLLEKFVAFSARNFQRCPEGRLYLESRGLRDPALFDAFRVGLVNGALLDALPPDDESLTDLATLGLVDGRGQEHFRDCVVFPVFTQHGAVGEIYGRKIADGPVKHLYLRGPHRVWNQAGLRTANGDALLTECIIDAATLWQHGFHNVTATYGCRGLTEDHLALFQRHLIQRVTLVFDADRSGREGAASLAPRLVKAGIEVREVELPEGHDVNSFFADGHTPADFKALVDHARPYTENTFARAPSFTVNCSVNRKEEQGPADNGPVPKNTPPRELQTREIENGFSVAFGARTYEIFALEPVRNGRKGSLRATIKAVTSNAHFFEINSFDLYSARARKSFVTDVAALYREPRETITVDVNRIMQLCEERRRRDQSEREQPAAVTITDQDRHDGEAMGRDPDLFDRVCEDVAKCGFIGERPNVLAGYLTMTNRLIPKPLAMLIVSGSGAGKTALQRTMARLCPEEQRIELTQLSEKALFHMAENELRHKLLSIEEVAGAREAAYAIRSLISNGFLVSETAEPDPLTGRLIAVRKRTNGPSAVIEATTDPNLDPETQSRFLITSVDESRDHTRAIIAAQRAAGTMDGLRRKMWTEIVARKHHAFQRQLRPLQVVNPYGELLSFTDEYLMTRRDHPKYLSLIEAVAFTRQMSKTVHRLTIEGRKIEYIEVALEDIALANDLALALLGRSLGELSGPAYNLLLLIEKMVMEKATAYKLEPRAIDFTRRDIREYTKWSNYQVNQYIGQLVELEYIAAFHGKFGQQFRYRLLWDGQGQDGARFMLGLKPVEQLAADCGLQISYPKQSKFRNPKSEIRTNLFHGND